MESTRPIRALTRGLEALTVLNSRDGASVSEVAQEIRLPRTTVYRILETLCDASFAFRDADDRYRVSARVRSLSAGFEDEAWVARIAKPCIDDLGRDILWPVSVATLSGTELMLRETTDHTTPLANPRQSAGFRAPLLTSAAGRAFLAFCPSPQRDNLLALLARPHTEVDKPAQSQAELQNMLADIKAQGYATVARSLRLGDEVSIGVPVIAVGRVPAALSVRILSSSVPLKTGLERFLPKLRRCAARIGTLLSEYQAQAQSTGAPHAAV